jgi:hypothetical protein
MQENRKLLVYDDLNWGELRDERKINEHKFLMSKILLWPRTLNNQRVLCEVNLYFNVAT